MPHTPAPRPGDAEQLSPGKDPPPAGGAGRGGEGRPAGGLASPGEEGLSPLCDRPQILSPA